VSGLRVAACGNQRCGTARKMRRYQASRDRQVLAERDFVLEARPQSSSERRRPESGHRDWRAGCAGAQRRLPFTDSYSTSPVVHEPPLADDHSHAFDCQNKPSRRSTAVHPRPPTPDRRLLRWRGRHCCASIGSFRVLAAYGVGERLTPPSSLRVVPGRVARGVAGEEWRSPLAISCGSPPRPAGSGASRAPPKGLDVPRDGHR
jgi:hypothetical protein